jgi:hypothetical protein
MLSPVVALIVAVPFDGTVYQVVPLWVAPHAPKRIEIFPQTGRCQSVTQGGLEIGSLFKA